MARPTPRIILVEPDDAKRTVLVERLRAQGYQVDALASGAKAATLALGAPPSAVIADLWMPGVSGVQLCRLLRSELATESVPVILRGPNDTPRQRFWANRAGAAAYVAKGRTGELVRSLEIAIAAAPESDGFFQLHPDDIDIRDRISHELDAALYQSVLAAEVRSLSTAESLPRLFDLLSQFVCQVATYRWLAVATNDPARLCLHVHPEARERALAEARAVLEIGDDVLVECIEDDDASTLPEGPPAMRRDLCFGTSDVGRVAVAPVSAQEEDIALMDLIATELGGPIRIVTLVEQTKRMASHDALTGLFNRRAFTEMMAREIAEADRLNGETSLLLLDVDFFKKINDTHGHQSGDMVLTAIGESLRFATRAYDCAARWGGEEFVVALPHTGVDAAYQVAERIRKQIGSLVLTTSAGAAVPVTMSIGLATRASTESLEAIIERADRALYEAKANGRNRVVCAKPAAPARPAPISRRDGGSLPSPAVSEARPAVVHQDG